MLHSKTQGDADFGSAKAICQINVIKGLSHCCHVMCKYIPSGQVLESCMKILFTDSCEENKHPFKNNNSAALVIQC